MWNTKIHKIKKKYISKINVKNSRVNEASTTDNADKGQKRKFITLKIFRRNIKLQVDTGSELIIRN